MSTFEIRKPIDCTMRNIQVSVIIVNYNTRDLLRNCLSSILEYTSELTYEIIVVDNHSSDKSTDMLRQEFPQVKVVEAGDNVGFGNANNLGFQVAAGDYFLLLNSDTLLIDNSIKILYDYLHAHPDTGMCGGCIIKEDGSPGESFNYRWTIGKEIYFTFSPSKVQKLLRPYLFPITANHIREVDYITGADLMIPRSIVEQTGGFDTDFFMYYEESEWAFRVKQAGYKVMYVPSAQIIHLQGASVNKEALLKKRVFREAWISKFLYFHKVNGRKSPGRLFRVHRSKYLLARALLFWDTDKARYWEEKWMIIKECYSIAKARIQLHQQKFESSWK